MAEVVKDEAAGRTTWVQGQKGWYVDEEATRVLKAVELAQMPEIFTVAPLPPAGYNYVLLKEQ